MCSILEITPWSLRTAVTPDIYYSYYLFLFFIFSIGMTSIHTRNMLVELLTTSLLQWIRCVWWKHIKCSRITVFLIIDDKISPYIILLNYEVLTHSKLLKMYILEYRWSQFYHVEKIFNLCSMLFHVVMTYTDGFFSKNSVPQFKKNSLSGLNTE